jgi:hypothetical protein
MSLVAMAAVAAEGHEKVNHWLIGGIVLAILLTALLVLIAFGGGREHT